MNSCHKMSQLLSKRQLASSLDLLSTCAYVTSCMKRSGKQGLQEKVMQQCMLCDQKTLLCHAVIISLKPMLRSGQHGKTPQSRFLHSHPVQTAEATVYAQIKEKRDSLNEFRSWHFEIKGSLHDPKVSLDRFSGQISGPGPPAARRSAGVVAWAKTLHWLHQLHRSRSSPQDMS